MLLFSSHGMFDGIEEDKTLIIARKQERLASTSNPMVIKPCMGTFGHVGRCQVLLEKEIGNSINLVSRRKHEVPKVSKSSLTVETSQIETSSLSLGKTLLTLSLVHLTRGMLLL